MGEKFSILDYLFVYREDKKSEPLPVKTKEISKESVKDYAEKLKALELNQEGSDLFAEGEKVRLERKYSIAESKYRDALSKFEAAIKACDQIGFIWYNKGSVLKKLDDKDGARLAFETAVRLDEDYIGSFEVLAHLYFKEKRLDDMLRCLEKVLPHKPNDPNVLGEIGFCYIHMGNLDEALKYLNKSLKQKKDHHGSLLSKTYVHRVREEYKKALACSDELIKYFPDNATVWAQRGVIFKEMGKTGEALKCRSKVKELKGKQK